MMQCPGGHLAHAPKLSTGMDRRALLFVLLVCSALMSTTAEASPVPEPKPRLPGGGGINTSENPRTLPPNPVCLCLPPPCTCSPHPP
ncbi:arasin 2-like [Eriocheir sinensis]|uniref:arasin 2-like n=1 Tax=Eriocheir sinensis TaxID=95602 RepID=UPI0021C8195A|nr:arasin 2-like [Eriocheir sinensis]